MAGARRFHRMSCWITAETILDQECTLTEVIIIPKMPMTPTGKIGKQDLIKEFGI